jgi:uncharacterized membrane protein
MTAILTSEPRRPIHPLHAMLLAFIVPMFFGALLNDLAYASTYHVQWINFADWMILGGLVGGGLTLVWAIIIAIIDRGARTQRYWLFLALLAITWALGFFNALVHAKDAWGTMPAALWLSVGTTAFAVATSWIGFSGLRSGELK